MYNKTRSFICLFIVLMTFLACSKAGDRDYPIKPVDLARTRISGGMWAFRMRINREKTIPYIFRKCEENGRLDNFAIAGGLKTGEQQGIYPFDDTDVYKILEAASCALTGRNDRTMEAYMDSVIVLIAGAQEEDGYLYTARTNKSERLRRWFGNERWEKLNGSHELYNAGHLYEAAVAHFLATGKRNLLDVALKNAEMVERTFGPGGVEKPPGHQVIEMGLVKLYRIMGEKKYLDLAKYFLDIRGKALGGRELGGEYNQDHKPVIEQTEAVGHAVRATYMYSAITDIAALYGEERYLDALNSLWKNTIERKLYITGGIGSTGSGEAFGRNDELPNMSAYNETCSSIGLLFWNHRMFLIEKDARYLDLFERTLYNAFLSGIALEGDRFFYTNPLESVGQHERSPWFGCACCPGNVARLIGSLPTYIYASDKKNVYVGLYIHSEVELEMGGQNVKIIQETDYPWEEEVKIRIETPKRSRFTVHLRIPAWVSGKPVENDLYRYLEKSQSPVSLKINGKSEKVVIRKGFAVLSRMWEGHNEIILRLPMKVKRVVANERVSADAGRVALERGPVVYCAEWADQGEGHVRHLLVPDSVTLVHVFRQDLLGGLHTLQGNAVSYTKKDTILSGKKSGLVLIPYYAWAHRGKGEMSVWIPRDESALKPLGQPTLASMSRVSASFGDYPEAVNDQLEPESSADHSVPFLHWWPQKGTTEWVQYEFPSQEEVSITDVYWFDDTGIGECRTPASWIILYREGEKWKPVYTEEHYGTEKDTFNRVIFETVITSGLRIEVVSRPGFASGIHEWRIK